MIHFLPYRTVGVPYGSHSILLIGSRSRLRMCIVEATHHTNSNKMVGASIFGVNAIINSCTVVIAAVYVPSKKEEEEHSPVAILVGWEVGTRWSWRVAAASD